MVAGIQICLLSLTETTQRQKGYNHCGVSSKSPSVLNPLARTWVSVDGEQLYALP